MSAALSALCLLLGQMPAASSPDAEPGRSYRAAPAPAPSPATVTAPGDPAVRTVQDGLDVPPPVVAVPDESEALPPAVARALRGDGGGLFRSDREFDGFTGPMSNIIQFKDPRALTEARLVFLNNFARPSTPVLKGGTFQVYALQLRLALTERLQVFADKDGIVRLSPKGGRSTTGLANINAGLKYAFIRDVENQFLFSGVIQYEPPTGYANVFQRNGSGLLGIYGVLGKEFADNWHLILQFGQNIPMQNQQSGYFMTDLHLDRRFGRITPFYEANWMSYNQAGKNLPLSIEGGGLINLGSRHINGMNYVTNAVGVKVDLSRNLELGLAYEYQLSDRVQLLNNMLHAQLIFRY